MGVAQRQAGPATPEHAQLAEFLQRNIAKMAE